MSVEGNYFVHSDKLGINESYFRSYSRMIHQNLIIKLNVYKGKVALYLKDPPSLPDIACCFIEEKYVYIKLP